MKKNIVLIVIPIAALSLSEHRAFAQVVSPPVPVLNNGYQAPNPLGWGQAGAAMAAPRWQPTDYGPSILPQPADPIAANMQQAIQANNAARNQFLLNQINNDFELRKQQQQQQFEMQEQAQQQAQQQQIQAQLDHNAAIERSYRILSATQLVRQTAGRDQARIEQGVAAIENP